MKNTLIEWADAVWNPITGCTPISEGCDHCYAKRMANRLGGRYGYDKKKPFRITEHPDKFKDPCRTKKPTRFFVCSMGDLFHYDIEFITIAKILWYARAAECKKHTFMFLTKRPERMRDFFFAYAKAEGFKLPIKNFWLGVTAENQQRLCERVAELLKIPAAVRFVSVEPMLGPVNLTQIDVEQHQEDWCVINALNGKHTDMGRPCHDVPRLDWVIAGGETGPGARPMNQDWVRSLRDQCVSNGVKFFFKGWGAWTGSADFESGKMVSGSKRKPRLLDGREWNDLPNNKP